MKIVWIFDTDNPMGCYLCEIYTHIYTHFRAILINRITSFSLSTHTQTHTTTDCAHYAYAFVFIRSARIRKSNYWIIYTPMFQIMKGKTFSVVRSCNKTSLDVYSSRCENLFCEVLVRYKCLHNTYSRLFLKHVIHSSWRAFVKMFGVKSFITRFPIAQLILFFFSQLVIFRFIRSTFESMCSDTETQSHRPTLTLIAK